MPILDALMFDKNVLLSDLSVFKEIVPNNYMLSNPENKGSVTEYLDFMYDKLNDNFIFNKNDFSFKKFEKCHINIYNNLGNEN